MELLKSKSSQQNIVPDLMANLSYLHNVGTHLSDGGGHHDEDVVEEADDGDAREDDEPEPDEHEDLLVHYVDGLEQSHSFPHIYT